LAQSLFEAKNMTGSTILMPLIRGATALLRATLRVEVLHGENLADLQSRRVPVLLALWHGRMFLIIDAHRGQGMVTMASKSNDGDIIAGWLENNGYVVVRGSTTRGGSEALRRMVYHMRAGRNGALTVDGPKGPVEVVQPGVVRLARLTGAWILPVSFSSSWPMFFNSWDRHLVPKPFSRNFVSYGEPFPIGSDLSEEAALTRIAAAINKTTEEVDEIAGICPPR
jgi:lysophospholipid acyltransferase (LPLAT)-like uncharacterized protein